MTLNPEGLLHMQETMGNIKQRTARCLQRYVREVPALTDALLEMDEVLQDLRAAAIRLFDAEAAYYRQKKGIGDWHEEAIKRTVTAALKIIPFGLLRSSRVMEAIPDIRDDLTSTLPTLVAQGQLGQGMSPGATQSGSIGDRKADQAGLESIETSDKGNEELLRGVDGDLKAHVTLDIASRCGGVGKRAIEKAVRKGSLESCGERANRRILVTSLLKYFPSEK